MLILGLDIVACVYFSLEIKWVAIMWIEQLARLGICRFEEASGSLCHQKENKVVFNVINVWEQLIFLKEHVIGDF